MALYLYADSWFDPVDGSRVKRSKGDELDVSAEVATWLKAHGLAGEKNPLEVPAVKPEPVPVKAEPVEDKPAEVASDRPSKSAKIDTWRAYAKQIGIDPKGLEKQEIIAAVIDAEGE